MTEIKEGTVIKKQEQLALSFALSEVNNYLHYLQTAYDDHKILQSEDMIKANHQAYRNYVNDVRERHGLEPIKTDNNSPLKKFQSSVKRLDK